LAALAKLSNPYLQRTGLKVITIWDQVTTGVAQAFDTNCPTLFGLTDQSGGAYTSVNQGLCTIGLAAAYSSATNDIISAITNAAKNWNGTAPLFLAAQAVVWNLGPTDLRNIAGALNTNEYVMVRPDQLFMLYNGVAGKPLAMTTTATRITSGTATLQGAVVPNASHASAWMEWGTNSNYGSKSVATNVTGNAIAAVSCPVTGLFPGIVYHYQVAVSNALGTVFGADKTFTTGGRLKAWGNGALGQTNFPPGQTNVVGISGGAFHGLAVKNDGSVIAWGYNGFGQTNVPAGLSDSVQVAAGMQHSLALRADGTVVAWGGNLYGQTNVPSGLSNVVAIAAGWYHNLALKADGTVTAWGYNNFGQTNVPSGLSNVVAIAAGEYHSLALKSDGTVVAWGNDSFGQTNVPAGLNNVVAISAGQYHGLAFKAGSSSLTNLQPVNEWVADTLTGSDGSSIGNWTDIFGGKNATQGTAGNQPKLYSNVLNGHKTVRFSSGSSQYLTVAAADSPISAAGSFTLAMVFKTSTAGSASSLFYDNTGLLGAEQPGVVPDWALCINGSQLGAGLGAGASGCGSDLSLYGGNVTDGNPHIAMYVRSGDTVSLYVDGAIVVTQSSLCTAERGDYNFQIGAMTTSSFFFNGDIAEIQLYNRALSPAEISGDDQILAAAYGVGGAAGTLVAWGSNASGQTNVPVAITNITAAASGSDFNLALAGNGVVTGWGDNNAGQTAGLPGLTNVSMVAAGTAFGLAIGNQTPLVTNAAVSGYVNHDLAFALPGNDPDGNPLGFRILSLPATGTLYQYLNGSRGSIINAANTPVNDPAGLLVFAPETDGTGNPYANFNFMAGDGFYNSGSAQMTVNVGLPAAPQFGNPFLNSAGPELNLDFFGSSNATYSVWASTNLQNWIKIGSAAEISAGQYQFVDALTNSPQQFYRASAP
jgi:alpha-tubulin suppressor-like RCC1 family protein